MDTQAQTTQPAIERGQTIPDFTLSAHNGETVSSRSYYIHRNLVIALLPDRIGPEWESWLERLSAARGQVDTADAQFLVIASDAVSGIQDFAERSATRSLKVLIDQRGDIRQKLGADEHAGQLLITDRYGVVFQSAAGQATDKAIDPPEIPGWVEFIYCRCS